VTELREEFSVGDSHGTFVFEEELTCAHYVCYSGVGLEVCDLVTLLQFYSRRQPRDVRI
jgi:hypothetical protein